LIWDQPNFANRSERSPCRQVLGQTEGLHGYRQADAGLDAVR
jgi:hypothetical protein